VAAVGSSVVGILLDTYHMKIEEQELADAICAAHRSISVPCSGSGVMLLGAGTSRYPIFLADLNKPTALIRSSVSAPPQPDLLAAMKERNWYERTFDKGDGSIRELSRNKEIP